MCKKRSVLASHASNVPSVTHHPGRVPLVIPTSRVLWLAAFAVAWSMTGLGGIVIGGVVGVDDPLDMADTSGDIKRIEAYVEDGSLNLVMTVHGIFAPDTQQTPPGMTNRYYYHWLLDTDNNEATGYHNSEYEGNATNILTPIGVDLVVQFGWRDGNTNGVYAYDALTEDSLFEDYPYTVEGDTIQAVILLEDLGLVQGQVIRVSAFQEGASNGWQVDWAESFELTLKDSSAQASDPMPVTDSNDVERDVTLSWTPGEFAATHTVYLGTDWADVNNANLANPLTVLLSDGQAEPNVDAGRLEFGQTYFWRVDEVNGTPDKTVFKGEVWTFQVEPYSIQIPGAEMAVTASSSSNAFSTPDKTIDGSGLTPDDAHDINSENMWFTAQVDLDPWIQFEFDTVRQLDAMKVWNSNSAAEIAIGWGVKAVEIAYSVDGQTWDVLDANQFSRAPGAFTYDQYDVIDFGGAAARVVRLNIQSNWGGVLMAYGLSEVQFYMIPASARYPEPASGAADVTPDATLLWRKGRQAAQHTVHWGTDPNAVAEGSAAAVTVSTPSLDLGSLDLALGQTYFWRVDEVNELEAVPLWTGPVWRFSTVDGLVVDDFERYRNDSPNRPFQTWHDGFGYSADEHFPQGYDGNGTGAGLGHDIWSVNSPHFNGNIMEVTTVFGGTQSLPLYYANTGGVASRIDLNWSTPQDWTAHGIQTLVLYFYGAQGNTGQLYVKVDDTVIPYDGAASDLTNESWNAWHIDLSALSVEGVDTLSIGVEGAGASGMLLLDGIGLYRVPPEWPPSEGQ